MTANRRLQSSANGTPPFNAQGWQVDADEEVVAIGKRVTERLGSVAGTNTVTASAAAADISAVTVLGQQYVIRPANTNTGAVTINIDGLGAKQLLDVDGNQLTAGRFVAGRDHLIAYDGTAFRILADGSAPPPSVLAPGPVKLDVQTASSSSSLIVGFGHLDNTYDRYRIVLNTMKPATDDVDFYMRVGTGSGPTIQTSASYRWSQIIAASASAATADTKIVSCGRAALGPGLGVGNASGENISGAIEFSNPETADLMEILYDFSYSAANNTGPRVSGNGCFLSLTAITAIQFLFSSGNIVSGTATLYGWPK